MMDDRSVFRRYLLGELGESEQETFERELLTSDEHFQELLISEDEVVDDYHAGKLDPSEERDYRQQFLVTSERRDQHRFGAVLRQYVSAAAARDDMGRPADHAVERPFDRIWRLAPAAAAVALVVAGLWSFRHSQPAPVRLEETARPVEGSTVALFLTTGSLRSLPLEAEPTLTVPAGVALVELQLDLPDGSPGVLEVTLQDARSEAILAEGTLPARTLEGQWVVVATVPSELLVPGSYSVVLRESAADGALAIRGTYGFRVTSP